MVVRVGRITAYPPGIIEYRQPKTAAVAPGWWVVAGKTCVAAYQPKGAASYVASKTNLASPGTYNCSDGAAYPTWDTAVGWSFVLTSSQYLDTGVTPAQDHTWSMFVAFNSATRDDWVNNWRALAGMQGFTAKFSFAIALFATGNVRYRHGGLLQTTNNATSGVLGFAGSTAYYNGSSAGTIPTGTTDTIYTITIGAENYTTPARFYTGNITGLAIYSATLTGTEAATLSTAMAAL